METLFFLNAGAEKAGSWKALADVLHVPQSTMSNWKAGDRPIPTKYAAVLATYLGIDPGKILVAMAADKASNEEERKLWLPFLGRAASVMLIASAFCVTYPGETQAQPRISGNSIFIM